MTIEQRKHIAASLRIIGMAQFASYGYIALKSGSWLQGYLSAVVYFILDGIAVYVLNKE